MRALRALRRAETELRETRRSELRGSRLGLLRRQIAAALGTLAPRPDPERPPGSDNDGTDVGSGQDGPTDQALVQRVFEVAGKLQGLGRSVAAELRQVEREQSAHADGLAQTLDRQSERVRRCEARVEALSRALSRSRKAALSERAERLAIADASESSMGALRLENAGLRERLAQFGHLGGEERTTTERAAAERAALEERVERLGENNRVLILEVESRGEEVAQVQRALAACESQLLQTRRRMDARIREGEAREAELRKAKARCESLQRELSASAERVHALSAQKSGSRVRCCSSATRTARLSTPRERSKSAWRSSCAACRRFGTRERAGAAPPARSAPGLARRGSCNGPQAASQGRRPAAGRGGRARRGLRGPGGRRVRAPILRRRVEPMPALDVAGSRPPPRRQVASPRRLDLSSTRGSPRLRTRRGAGCAVAAGHRVAEDGARPHRSAGRSLPRRVGRRRSGRRSGQRRGKLPAGSAGRSGRRADAARASLQRCTKRCSAV